MLGEEPNQEWLNTFTEYVRRLEKWSDEAISLEVVSVCDANDVSLY